MLKQTLKKIYKVTAPLHVRSSDMDSTEAKDILSSFSMDPDTTCIANNILDPKYDLQIIVPAYNVEKYISQCLESVLTQKTHYSYLVSVVNDGSADDTSEIINDYLEKYPDHLEVINQKNKGLSGARNAAMKVMKGRYVTFLDSDDVLEDGAIDAFMDNASGMDIVQGSWYTGSEIGGQQHQACHANGLSGYPWGKVFRAEILQHFQFPEGYWFEDTQISFILYGLHLKTKVIDNVIYGYRINPEGITSKSRFSRKSVDSFYITELCLKEFPIFGARYDQGAYEYFLNQCRTNQRRAFHQPKNVQEAIFILECELRNHYFPDCRAMGNKDLECIENALEKRQFARFRILTL